MTAIRTGIIDGAAPSETINDLVHEAMLEYEEALKSSIQIQEDSVKLWRDLLAEAGSLAEIQRRLDSLSDEVFPNLRKHLEELVESSALSLMLVNRAGSQMLDLLGKSLEIYGATSIADARRRLEDLVDSSLAAMREDIPVLVTAQAKIVRSWKGMAELAPLKNVFASAQVFPPERAA